MKFTSLFSGIGGFDLGFERAGMECVAQVEIDEFCQKILNKHWPNVPKFKDVRDVGKHNLPAADLICGGFPCQPHSYAGKRRGKADDRNLWPEYLRIIRETQPRLVVGENVPGLITSMLDEIIFDLESLEYTCRTFVIPACALDALHRRDRVFVVAYSNSGGHIHGQSEKQPTETRLDALCEPQPSGAYVADSIGQRGRGGNDQWQDAIHANPRSQIVGPGGNCGRWTAEPGVGRVANGIPDRVDRLRALGNAVVPQVAEFVGRCIMESL